jgi:hypothetical protein
MKKKKKRRRRMSKRPVGRCHSKGQYSLGESERFVFSFFLNRPIGRPMLIHYYIDCVRTPSAILVLHIEVTIQPISFVLDRVTLGGIINEKNLEFYYIIEKKKFHLIELFEYVLIII